MDKRNTKKNAEIIQALKIISSTGDLSMTVARQTELPKAKKKVMKWTKSIGKFSESTLHSSDCD